MKIENCMKCETPVEMTDEAYAQYRDLVSRGACVFLYCDACYESREKLADEPIKETPRVLPLP